LETLFRDRQSDGIKSSHVHLIGCLVGGLVGQCKERSAWAWEARAAVNL
jgi:hypothetical protein